MKSFVLLVLGFLMINAGHTGHVGLIVGPGEPTTIIQGPGSKASLLGPDGSHISSAVAGGTVVSPAKAGGVVSASVSPGYAAVAAPFVAPVPVAAAIPSGLGVHGLGLAGLGLAAAPGSGLEGQYVHDNTELLYDDGSYRDGAHDGLY